MAWSSLRVHKEISCQKYFVFHDTNVVFVVIWGFVRVYSDFFVTFISRVSLLILRLINGDHNSVARCLLEQWLFGRQDAGSTGAVAQAGQTLFLESLILCFEDVDISSAAIMNWRKIAQKDNLD